MRSPGRGLIIHFSARRGGLHTRRQTFLDATTIYITASTHYYAELEILALHIDFLRYFTS